MSGTQIIDGRDEGGNTDLMRAALNGQSETVKALLLSGADVNARNHEGRTALMFAIMETAIIFFAVWKNFGYNMVILLAGLQTIPNELYEAARIDDPLWYKDAVIYQAHVRSFSDSTNDGVGDFPGLTQKLDYLQSLK